MLSAIHDAIRRHPKEKRDHCSGDKRYNLWGDRSQAISSH